MVYRVCKSFEIESGHMLSKHPGRCKYPHGHSRRVDLVIASGHLGDGDMVCDFKSLKLAVEDYIDSYDHALMVNSKDPILDQLTQENQSRVIVCEDEDPTTEVLARRIYKYVSAQLVSGGTYADRNGKEFVLPAGLTLERVRVTETSSSWAEYGIS
ncbi:MAG: 6-carboxytetrahydropterin synthase [Phycisphaerales bacterium]|nr:6-carboxytetrahydropterin synthase [Phycisphaerales bacterium]